MDWLPVSTYTANLKVVPGAISPYEKSVFNSILLSVSISLIWRPSSAYKIPKLLSVPLYNRNDALSQVTNSGDGSGISP